MLPAMKLNRKWIVLLGVAATLPTAVALASGAGDRGRMGLSARTGQWTAGSCGTTEFRTALGGEGFIEWLGENLRVTLGARLMRESTQSISGDGATPPGAGDVQMTTSVLVAWRHDFFELGAGVGYLRYSDVGHATKGILLPAASLRAGPEWLYLSSSLLDFSPENLGIGTFRLGLGGEIGKVDLWGGLGVQPHLGGITAGVMFPITEHLRGRVDGLFGGQAGGHTSFEGGLGLSYEFLEGPMAGPL
jgi:hypothetical protein